MNTMQSLLRGAVVAAAWLALPAWSATPEVSATLERHGIQPHATAARNAPGWHAPRKILLLQFDARWSALEEMRAVAPGARFVTAGNPQAAVTEAADADVIIGFNPDICNARMLEAARQLRWLVSLNAGVELCAGQTALHTRGFTMTNMRGIDSPVIAEHAIALMLALAHGLDRFAVDTSRRLWSRGSAATVPMQFLEGKTMLVSGLGGIGTEVARRAHGLGMRVVATRVGGTGKPDFVEHVGQPDELLRLAATADVVVSAVPLTPETTGLYDERFFAALKPSALFINVARGGSVKTEALMKALNEGRLAGAGLDVVDPEPLPSDHPLWDSPRILLTPHISGRSDLPGDARWTVAVENLRRYTAGEPLLNVVDLARGY